MNDEELRVWLQSIEARLARIEEHIARIYMMMLARHRKESEQWQEQNPNPNQQKPQNLA